MKWSAFVAGEPAPYRERTGITKAGKVYSHRTQSCAGWEHTVRLYAQQNPPERVLLGPLRMDVDFALHRPKSRPKRCRFPDRRPDRTSLLRAAEDALSGIVFQDDKQVVQGNTTKTYAPLGLPTGVYIVVEEIEPEEVEKDLERERRRKK